jgi:hypothetical protein
MEIWGGLGATLKLPRSHGIISFVIPGLDPGIHVDGRVKPGHDEEGADSTCMDIAQVAEE